jgi:hypothetical protein
MISLPAYLPLVDTVAFAAAATIAASAQWREQ